MPKPENRFLFSNIHKLNFESPNKGNDIITCDIYLVDVAWTYFSFADDSQPRVCLLKGKKAFRWRLVWRPRMPPFEDIII